MKIVPEKMVAHRGESFEAPENTKAAINLAWHRGAKAVEIDVQLTADNEIVVIHDRHTGRVGDKKLLIKKSKLQELRTVDLGIKKDAVYKGEKIPTLNEILETIPSDGKLIIEVKCGEEIIEPLKKLFINTKLRNDQIEIISFDLVLISKIKVELPQHKALWLLDLDYYWPSWLLRVDPLKIINKIEENGLDGVDVWAGKVIDESFVNTFLNRGLLLYTWTVNDVALAKKLLSFGVDAITTDRASWLSKHITGIKQ